VYNAVKTADRGLGPTVRSSVLLK